MWHLESQREPEAIPGHSEPVTFRATAVLPFNNLALATPALRGRLRLMITNHDAGLTPDWDTLVVKPPTTRRDARGNTWFEWTATVEATTLSSGQHTDDQTVGAGAANAASHPEPIDAEIVDEPERGSRTSDGSIAGPVSSRPTVEDQGLLRRFRS